MRVFLAAAILAIRLSGATLAITGAHVYTSASARPMENASVVMTDGKISAVGERVSIPAGAQIVRCDGCAVMAGFWNCHIHFTEPKWNGAEHLPKTQLAEQLRAMLLRSGFTTVVDTGSNPDDTVALRKRIESGEIPGPRIYTAGIPVYPPDGIPYYVRETMPPDFLKAMAPPHTPADAAARVEGNIKAGTDIVKLFTGSWVERGKVKPMPEAIAAAAVAAGHRHGQLVFTHPSSLAGIQVAIASGVDVLAHAPDDIRGVDDGVLRTAASKHMAMIPTLKLFRDDEDIAGIRRIVHNFHGLGGQLLFGTDTGYLTDYDVGEEFSQLQQAGLSVSEIVGMLTENPAGRFGVQNEKGHIAVGMTADVTVLAADPASDKSAFSKVAYTIRGGRIIYSK